MTKKNESKELQLYNNNTAIDIKKAAWNALSPESQKSYQSDYKLFDEFMNKSIKNITANDILLYIEHLREIGRTNKTINRKVASLSKRFKVAMMAGEIKTNPIEVLKEFKNISMKTQKKEQTLMMADIKKIMKPRKNDTVYTRQLILIIRTLAKTGMRISELTGIQNKDITKHGKDDKLIRIVGKGRKERFIFMENSFYDEIKAMYPDIPECDYLFYSSLKRRYCRKALWKRSRRFFMERLEEKFHPHMARHAFITFMISGKKNDIKAVSKYVGHSDPSTTFGYVDTVLDSKDSKVKI